MTVSANTVAPQQRSDFAGSTENLAGNPTGSSTATNQPPSTNTFDPSDLVGLVDLRALDEAIEDSSLTKPEQKIQDKLLEKIDSTLAKVESIDIKTLLMDFESIMALMVEFAQELRKNGRETRAANVLSSVNMLNAAADEIKKAGEANYKAAMITSALKILTGAIQIGSAVAAFGLSMSAMKATATGDKAAAGIANAQAELIKGVSQGMGTILDGIGTMATAGLKMDAATADSMRAKFEAWSKGKDSKSSEGNEDFMRAGELLKAVIDALENRQRSGNEINLSIVRKF